MRAGHCLCLQVDPELLRDWEICCKSLGVELRAQFPASLGAGQLLVSEGGYVLTRVAADHAGGPFSSSVPAVSIIYPPLVAITEGAPSAKLLEVLRLQGAVAVLSHPFAAESVAKQVDLVSLAQSANWPKGTIDRMPLAQALEHAEMRRYMLVVACPHRRPLSPVPWSPRLRECQETEACSGWFARIYVNNGTVIHAEAPGAVGAEAIAKISRLERGSFRFFPTFIEAGEAAPCGPVSDVVNLLRTRAASANQPTTTRPPVPAPPSLPSAKGSEAKPARPGPPTAPSPSKEKGATVTDEATVQNLRAGATPNELPEVERSTPMDGVKKVLSAASGLKCAARADSNGVVLEVAGQIDAEQLCAVVAMSHPPLEQAAETLGLGKLQRWAAVTPTVTVYVDIDQNGFVAVTGEPNKNPDATLQKIHTKLG